MSYNLAGVVIESNEPLFAKLIEWVWIPLTLAILSVWRLVAALDKTVDARMGTLDKTTDKRLSLLEQHFLNIEAKLSEGEKNRREDRQEIMDKIDRHHEIIYKKLDAMSERQQRR